METNQNMDFFILARPVAILSKHKTFVSGIASFGINDIYGNNFVFLSGHKTNFDIDRIFLIESLLISEKNPDGSEKRLVGRIGYEEAFDTNVGLFLKREEMSGMATFNYKTVTNGYPKVGNAHILTTIDGFEPQMYSCHIKKVFDDVVQDMSFIIDISDDKLLQTFGGGTMGMSGSVIMQDEKIVGILSAGPAKTSREGYCVNINQIINKLQTISMEKEKSK